MSTSSNSKIPRIELTRERSSTLESIQSLTRAIRESLRLHSVRREKKRRQKKAAKGESSFLDVKDSKRIRSKSMDDGKVEDEVDGYNEISDIGISGVVVSDIGPATDSGQSYLTHTTPQPQEQTEVEVFEDAKDQEDKQTIMLDEQKQIECEQNRQRRHSKSVDEVELAHMRKQKQLMQQQQAQQQQGEDELARRSKPPQMSLDIVDREMDGKPPARQASVPNAASCSVRRKSKDDSEVTKVDASVLRKRFARLLDTLRSHKFSISSLEENGTHLKSDSNV